MNFDNFFDNFNTFQRATFNPLSCLTPAEDGLNPSRLFKCLEYKFNMYKENPYYFKPEGLLTFHGSQGTGKTLTAAAVYLHQLLKKYPKAILVSNTAILDRPFNAYVYHNKIPEDKLKKMYSDVMPVRCESWYKEVVEKIKKNFYKIKYPEFTLEDYIKSQLLFYPFNHLDDFEAFCQEQQYQIRMIDTDEIVTQETILSGLHSNVTIQYTGLDCLKYINNGFLGVIQFIDEIQLELNSLQSSNISMDVIIEVSQLRKQRKHIIGSSQMLTRIAKAVREQLRDIVVCKCFFGCIQYNQLTNRDHLYEDASGKVTYDVLRRMLFFHDPSYYDYYDTYAKMRRYNNEWQGRSQLTAILGGIDIERLIK